MVGTQRKEETMKEKLFCLLAALSLLTLTGCDLGVIGGADGPTAIYTAGSPDAPEKVTLPVAPAEPEETPATQPEEPPAVPEDPGTAAGAEDDAPYEDLPAIDEDGSYNSMEDVSLYLHTYDHLPDNYITKQEARDLGWSGGSVERYAPGCAIGGDRFGNREGLLPSEKGRTYYECDIDTIGETSRGAKRIIFSSDGLIYYTEDHYESFTLLYGEE
jgi:hypothetical protein